MLRKSMLAVAVTAATGLTLLPAPAYAGTNTDVVARSVSSLGVADLTSQCDGANTGKVATVNASGALHQGALAFTVGSNPSSDPYVEKDFASAVPLSSLNAFSFQYSRGPYAAGVPLFLDLIVDQDGNTGTTTDIDDILLEATPDATWQTADALVDTLSLNGTTSTTMGAYKTAHSSAVLLAYTFDAGCDTSAANAGVVMDSFVLGTNGTDTTTYDFEPATTLTISGAGTISYGATRVLTATLKNGTAAAAGYAVDIYAKAYGASAYTKIGTTGLTNSSGVATLSVKPSTNTSYYAKIAAAEPNHGAAQSATAAVNVATVLSRNVYDTTLTTSQPLLVYGLTKPAKPGAYVYLYRGTTNYGSAKVQSDGTYLLQRTLAKGSYTFVVKIGAVTGNVAGASASFGVTVS